MRHTIIGLFRGQKLHPTRHFFEGHSIAKDQIWEFPRIFFLSPCGRDTFFLHDKFLHCVMAKHKEDDEAGKKAAPVGLLFAWNFRHSVLPLMRSKVGLNNWTPYQHWSVCFLFAFIFGVEWWHCTSLLCLLLQLDLGRGRVFEKSKNLAKMKKALKCRLRPIGLRKLGLFWFL